MLRAFLLAAFALAGVCGNLMGAQDAPSPPPPSPPSDSPAVPAEVLPPPPSHPAPLPPPPSDAEAPAGNGTATGLPPAPGATVPAPAEAEAQSPDPAQTQAPAEAGDAKTSPAPSDPESAEGIPGEMLPPAPLGEHGIRFTAWNLKNFLHVAAPPPPGSTEKSKPSREIAAVVETLLRLRPDVLGVCEMGSAADLALLQSRLREGGLDLPNAEWVDGADSSRHLALLSRFPMASRQAVTSQRYVLDDSQFAVQRGFLDVTLRVNPDYQIRLIGVHLKSRLDVPEGDQELMRRNEAHLLRQHLDSVLVADPDLNLLVYGDFNDTRDQPSVKAVKGMRGAAAALNEIPAADESGERWTFYYPTADEYSRIDFLLASSGLMPEVRKGQAFLTGGPGWSRASDHRPLTLDLTAGESRARSRPKAKTKARTKAPEAAASAVP